MVACLSSTYNNHPSRLICLVVEVGVNRNSVSTMGGSLWVLRAMESGGRASQPTLPDRHMESYGNVDAEPYHNVLAAEHTSCKRGIGQVELVAFAIRFDADGYLRVHGLECCSNGGDSLSLRGIDGEKISSMCLFLDWNPPATSISVGLSDGFVSAFSFPESQLDVIQEWKAHEFELWAASFHIHQPQLVYTVVRMIANSVGI
ncbi:hypothetical protein DKX38_018726 [Salix brachista]|uniref:Uncharacterized protein n=1 Tax=Salix brachista TaxID=2182728 RepID=A0A5N5KPL4_9ROSI|nr:hypothetical protein DKX38_018726 [Salix brachista]